MARPKAAPTVDSVDSFEGLKKIGAGVLILLITIMMGIMFLPGDIQDFTGTFTSSAVGSYRGRPISQIDYALMYQACAQQNQSFGDEKFRDMAVRNCTSRELRGFYVLADIASEFGLTVSEGRVQEDVIRMARETHRMQDLSPKDSEDRLSLDEIYNRQIRSMPISYRKRGMDAEMVSRVLRRNFPFPDAQLAAERAARVATLDARFVRYSAAQLSRSVEPRVRATEAEVRKAYEEEQAKLTPDKRKPYQDERLNVERRVLAQKREAAVKQLKEQLSKLGDSFTLEQVSTLTRVAPSEVRGAPLGNLSEAKTTAGGTVNLAIPELILKIAPDAAAVRVGPVTRDEFTYYIELRNVRVPALPPADAKAEDSQREAREQGPRLASYMLVDMIDQQAQRGEFKLKRDIFQQ